MIKLAQGIGLGLRTLFHIPHRHPTMAQVNITNRCDMRCRMCPREVLSLPDVDMALDRALQVIDRLGPVRRLALVGLGEPLLHPDLDEMIRYAESRGIQTQVTTNGLRLDSEERARSLFRTGLHSLAFSMEDLHGRSSYGHSNARAAQTVENCIRIRAELGTKRPAITVQIVLLEENLAGVEEIVRWAESVGVDHVNLTRTNALLDPSLRRPGVKGEAEFFSKLRRLRRRRALRVDCFQDQILPGALGYLYRRLLPFARLDEWCVKWSYYVYIDINGNILPCSGLFPDRRALGNIFVDRLSDVWNGPAFRALRGSKAKRVPCRHCDNLRLKQRVSPGLDAMKGSREAGR